MGQVLHGGATTTEAVRRASPPATAGVGSGSHVSTSRQAAATLMPSTSPQSRSPSPWYGMGPPCDVESRLKPVGNPRRIRAEGRWYDGTEAIVTDLLASYGAALNTPGTAGKCETGRRLNNRADNSHQTSRRNERAMLRFRQMRTLQKSAALHGSIHHHLNSERTLVNRQIFKYCRTAALAEWRHLCAA